MKAAVKKNFSNDTLKRKSIKGRNTFVSNAKGVSVLPNNKYEQEADRVTDQVIRIFEPKIAKFRIVYSKLKYKNHFIGDNYNGKDNHWNPRPR